MSIKLNYIHRKSVRRPEQTLLVCRPRFPHRRFKIERAQQNAGRAQLVLPAGIEPTTAP